MTYRRGQKVKVKIKVWVKEDALKRKGMNADRFAFIRMRNDSTDRNAWQKPNAARIHKGDFEKKIFETFDEWTQAVI